MADPAPTPEEPRALVRLMTAHFDPAGLTDDELVAAARDAAVTKKRAETAAAAELARRGWSWRQIGAALGVHHTTAYGWVRDAGLLTEVEAAAAARRDARPPTAEGRPPR